MFGFPEHTHQTGTVRLLLTISIRMNIFEQRKQRDSLKFLSSPSTVYVPKLVNTDAGKLALTITTAYLSDKTVDGSGQERRIQTKACLHPVISRSAS